MLISNQQWFNQQTLIRDCIVYVIFGIIIGGGAILPGISGGVLCVVFGLYRTLMDLFVHPIDTIKKNYRMLIALGIGCILGFFVFAGIIDWMFKASELYATWLFIGLIAGSARSLYQEAGEQGHPLKAWVGFFLAFTAFFGLLLFIKTGEMLTVKPSVMWFAFCGILWGFSIVVPGMTSSSILISMGLYQPMTAGIASFDPSVIIPGGIGLVLVVIAFARIIRWLFNKYYAIAYHCVLGFALASTIIIIPINGYRGLTEILCSILYFSIGFVAALLTERLPRSQERG